MQHYTEDPLMEDPRNEHRLVLEPVGTSKTLFGTTTAVFAAGCTAGDWADPRRYDRDGHFEGFDLHMHNIQRKVHEAATRPATVSLASSTMAKRPGPSPTQQQMGPDLILLSEAFADARADEPAQQGPPVADPVTGEIRILKDRCTTCILNPSETAIPLRPGRLKSFIEEVRFRRDAHVVCHSTLPPIAPAGTQPAMCRGFVDAYGFPAAVTEAIETGVGHLVEVSDPKATTNHAV